MPEYRKGKLGGDTWHSCRHCPADPKSDYLVRYVAPARDRDLCLECSAIASEDVCRRALEQ
jgi:hypothetical protein